MFFSPPVRFRPGRLGVALIAGCSPWLAGLPRPAAGEGFESWQKVEQSQETSEYALQVGEGRFDAEQRAFVERTLLPQLALEANRFQIASVRQRIREVASRGAKKTELDQANAVIRDGMLGVVADETAELVVRVNAMLLVGELQSSDRRPWPGSLEPVAKAAADAALPLAVRVAAVQGLARQVAAGGVAKEAAPVVAALIDNPPKGDPVAVRWLVSRALELLPVVSGPTTAVKAAAGILADGTADTDLRVRAAFAVGRLATPETGIDAAAAIGQIRSLAISALTADLDAAAARRLDRELSGGGGPDSGSAPSAVPPVPPPAAEPGFGGLLGGAGGGELGAEAAPPAVFDEYAVPPLACRRNAWRLFTLAEAVHPAGLAGLLQGAPAAAASDLATAMRQSAANLDARPEEAVLAEALEAIKRLASTPLPTTDEQPADGRQAPASPFDQPSPF